VKLTLYTKPGCCLCAEARAMIDRLQEERDFEIEEVDIEGDPGLAGEYGERVPVVFLDGSPVQELEIDERALRRRVDEQMQAVG
jgi:glutaredoxin